MNLQPDKSPILLPRRKALTLFGGTALLAGCGTLGQGVAGRGSVAAASRAAVDLTGGLAPEREYFLRTKPAEPRIRDATNIWLEEESGRFGMRIGIEAVAYSWDSPDVWLDIAFPDGRVISRRTQDPLRTEMDASGKPAIRGAGPLTFQCIEPFKRWLVSFDGEADEITAAGLIVNPDPRPEVIQSVRFEIELTMAVPPWIPGTMSLDAEKAMSGDQGKMVSARYEQLFRATGDMKIGNETFDVNGQGLRIRRQGFRQFAGFWGHCWQSCLFPSGKAFGFNIFPPRPDGKPNYAEGYIFDGSGGLQPARPVGVPWMTSLQVSGDDVPIELETANGNIVIEGTSYVNLRSRNLEVMPPALPPDFPTIQQSHVLYRWGDELATGMMERSTQPSKLV